MTITVSQLVATESLRTRLLAGAAGSNGEVRWAHVCELSQPWEWVGSGDLVLTSGLGIPHDSAGQIQYLEQLHKVGAAGVVIGERMNAPPLTVEMLGLADSVGFPVLLTSYEIRFSRISHTVAMANVDHHTEQLVHSLRILDRVRHLVDGADGSVLDGLAQDLGCPLALVDASTWQVVPPDSNDIVSADLVASLRVHVDSVRPERPWLMTTDIMQVLVTPIARPRALLLLAGIGPGARPELFSLEQAATVISVEQAYVVASRERNRRLRSSALAHLVDHRLDDEMVAEVLAEAGLQGAAVLVLATEPEGVSSFKDLHHGLDGAGVAHMMLPRGDVLVVLLPDDPTAVAGFTALLVEGCMAGISSSFDPHSGFTVAMAQARAALRSASAPRPVLNYQHVATRSPFLPRTRSELRDLAVDILGDLMAYDAEHDSGLVNTLLVFLEVNRGWQKAASALSIHRQTLVYRINRIESIIGRSLRSTGDVSEIWLALQAGIETGLVMGDDNGGPQ